MGALLFEPFHQPEESEQALKQALALDPLNVDARFWLAEVLVHEYVDEQQARLVLEEALEIDPNRADCLLLLASVLRGLGGGVQSYLPVLEKAAERAPAWPAVHADLAQALLEIGETRRAEAEVRKSLELIGEGQADQEGVEGYRQLVLAGGSSVQREFSKTLLRQIERRKARNAR